MSLYHPSFEKENCGFGLIAQMDGEACHKIVQLAVQSLDKLKHRGGIAADGKTGDGCGILMQTPTEFFTEIAKENEWHLSRKFAVGVLFLSKNQQKSDHVKLKLEEELAKETLSIAGWRTVPTDEQVLGEIAAESEPQILQVLINSPIGWRVKDLERRLYMARRRLEQSITDDPDFYIASLSGQVVVYKGLMMPEDLDKYYPDLKNSKLKSSICLFHQRFSTNTNPKWPLAQPFRYLAHNGEINTITANRQWMKARSYKFHSPLLPDLQQAKPFVNGSGSDSSSLDNMLEMLLSGGMDLYRAMRLLIPPAWQSNPEMDEELKAFYDFNSMHMEPWDGPAGVVMTNGRYAACSVDRNGLRPSRYIITSDRILTVSSEVGIWAYADRDVVTKGRIGPGELLVIDTLKGKLFQSFEIDNDLKRRHPYKEWMKQHSTLLKPAEKIPESQQGHGEMSGQELLLYQKQFGYTKEELEQIIWPIAANAQEATGSMGDDTPIAVLSLKQRSLYDFFRQKFAQVTNPPIDPLREKHVMSLSTCAGREQNLFNETTGHAYRVMFQSPILLYSDFNQLKNLNPTYYKHDTIELAYAETEKLETALHRIADKAKNFAESGTTLLILSDRIVDKTQLTMPALLAVGIIHRTLVENDLRCDSNIIVETGTTKDPHHFAVLLGFGATAIYPYLVYESLASMAKRKNKQNTQLNLDYRTGIEKGLRKIISKMGISAVSSYRCSQQFEIIGLNDNVVETCFYGACSRINGIGFEEISAAQMALHEHAQREFLPLSQGGQLKYVNDSEYHCFNPDVVTTLHSALKHKNYAEYKRFSTLVDKRPTATLRDLLKIQSMDSAVDITEVEPAKSMYPRFDTAAMSIGALSPEAHEALAIAMNQLGGRSNSGEGGEDAGRYNTKRNSAIKQVASGRFGVTAKYLVNADVLQIKIAQGAKPGEGGQLPGHKVSIEIAKLRYAKPGVTLISPPPHHDIYSIEDLAQLIFDLKQVNPKALVSVKLVSSPGIGTIATGVAKAYADMITVSGYDGGTGASPITSVKYAGSPWELGLAEVHQTLVKNGVRHKIRLQVDGGLKTATDIIKATLLGAESFGFGTVPMLALGCKYLRICHLNNCATGVATQDRNLRENHYHGQPERVMQYFDFLAQDLREQLAQLGATSIEEIIGRSELLTQIQSHHSQHQHLDLSRILAKEVSTQNTPTKWTERNFPKDIGEMNQTLLKACKQVIEKNSSFIGHFDINNTDRSVGASIAGFIAQQKHPNQKQLHLKLCFKGSAGQSFGVWNNHGMSLYLCGDSNDYVGKGMSGGKIVIHPPLESRFASEEATIIGNTCLYGATGGELYAAGQAGERFAVRNSGATSVVEGVGDNACEYMTGGTVVVLGQTGVNFGAGMTGGCAYVFDQFSQFKKRVNNDLIETINLTHKGHQDYLKHLLEIHILETNSKHAQHILEEFEHWKHCFMLVKPKQSDINELLVFEARNSMLIMRQG